MDILQVKDKDDLHILEGKQAAFEQLKFEFPDTYIKSLKDNLDLKNAIQLIMKDWDDFCWYLAGYEHKFWEGFLYLRELFIDPNYQWKWIWTKLVNQFIEKARELNLKGVMTQTEFENIPAQKLYEKLGFVRIENKDWNEWITYRLLFDK